MPNGIRSFNNDARGIGVRLTSRDGLNEIRRKDDGGSGGGDETGGPTDGEQNAPPAFTSDKYPLTPCDAFRITVAESRKAVARSAK